MTPVILLSDGYLANGAEPWRIPDFDNLPEFDVGFATEPNGPNGEFLPYLTGKGSADGQRLIRPRQP